MNQKESGTVIISQGVESKKATYITVGNNSTVEIGSNCTFHGEVIIYTKTDCHVAIGDNCILIDSRIVCGSNATVTIGNGTTINDHSAIFCRTGYEISIGADCMFSQEVILHAGDAHPIYDTISQEITNCPDPGSSKRAIRVDKHVWLGWGCMLLHGSKIGKGSIVAARSLVTKQFPNNCLVAGHPATQKKVNVGWKRFEGCDTPDDYLLPTSNN